MATPVAFTRCRALGSKPGNSDSQSSWNSGGTFRPEIHDITASDDHVVVLLHETGERGTKTLDENFIHVWHVKGGKATEFWGVGTDQNAWDEFWA
jgi:ketosteroid isomerase-like protein